MLGQGKKLRKLFILFQLIFLILKEKHGAQTITLTLNTIENLLPSLKQNS